MTQVPPSAYGDPSVPLKPGQVTAIAILCIVSGVMDCLGIMTLLVCWPFGIYSLIVGIFELLYGIRLLAEPPTTSRPNQTLAIMQIINITNCSVLAVVTGILSLVFYGDVRVRAYFESLRRMGIPS